MKRKFKFPYCRCINVNTQTGARMNVNYKIRAVQLDLARQMETMEFLKNFIDFIAEHHYNTLFLYLEWRVRTKTFDIGKKEGYSAEELRELIDYAGTRGIEIIPGLAALGHAELILNQKKFESYAELRNGMHGRFHSTQKHDFCPSHPGMRKFLESYFSEVAAIFMSAATRHGTSVAVRNARKRPRHTGVKRRFTAIISPSATGSSRRNSANA